ncbi:kinase-like domain-containing protein [Hygrophoropsis aurantiaca]|uniref:Kinase-like domain-containing protein n=1 Tax=Hygrophoropsis aurantiaca TaxID=72124 RepID=A0ACB8AEX9_9AGAM|nr:kinase-like domain-containing protein [Hygrophoropsis aurantiaca]
MLKGLGKLTKKASTATLSAGDEPARSTTPTPMNPSGKPASRTGLLTIRVLWAEDLALPAGTVVPPAVQSVLTTSQAKVAASVSPSSVTQRRLAKKHGAKDSIQRTQCWWLPYLVMEFEVNQVLITPLGGELGKPLYMYQAQFDVSRNSEISIQCYLRTEQPKVGSDGLADDMGNDIFMGGVKFTPDFDNVGSIGQDAWYELTGGKGKIQMGVAYQPNLPGQSLTIDDFELITVIGKGSFGKVMQVRKRDTMRIYALKTIRKAHIVDRKEITHTLAERLVLARVNNPFIVPLKFSFQSEQKLYLVLAFVNGGELFHHLQREQRFNEERARFYSAELLLALEHLHELDVVYRDLKPENILLDYTGHIALCDFGLCKLNMKDSDTTNTFCGTPEYLAPEILNAQGYNKTIDWWTLGVLLYEMLSGLPPFYDEVTDKMYQKILTDPLVFGADINPQARSILTCLLNRDPSRRLGVNGAEEIKKHPFFDQHIDFKKLLQKKIQPPFKPSVSSPVDVSNFDTVFTTEEAIDSYVDGSHLSQTVQAQFAGFSYDGSNMPVSSA